MTKKSKSSESFAHDQRMGARRTLLEELFNDIYDDRTKIYRMNFLRGIFFGVGSVMGATIVVALLIWTLSLFTDLPGIGQAAQEAQTQLKSK